MDAKIVIGCIGVIVLGFVLEPLLRSSKGSSTTQIDYCAQQLESDNPSVHRAHTLFCDAQIARRNQDYDKAIVLFEQRLADPYQNISFHELFYAQYQIPMCMIRSPNYSDAENVGVYKSLFLKAYAMDPFRKEPLFHLAQLNAVERQYSACLLYTHAAMAIKRPWRDTLYVDQDIYRWKLYDQHALCLYYVGRRGEAHEYWKFLLDGGELPESEKMRIGRNLKLKSGLS